MALKTIAAYRGGLQDLSGSLIAALEANAATGDPLPVQVHTGFGDADLSLPLSRPGLLKPLIERFDTTRSCSCTATRSRARRAGSPTSTRTSTSTSR